VSPRFAILLYHGVSAREHRGIENYSRKHVSADSFAAQMAELASCETVLPLRELLARRAEGTLPRRSVAVTFDDGFANNHEVAYPILREHGIPATIYLATGLVGTERVFWVDRLEYLVNEWPSAELRADTLGAAYPVASQADRLRAVTGLKAALKAQPALVPATLEQLESDFGGVPRYDYPDYRLMGWDQVRELARGGLCDFGAHTIDHVILAAEPPEEQERQVRGSLEAVARELGRPTDLFSYPEGGPGQYDETTVAIVRAAGCTSSPTAIFGVNDETTSPFHLRRNMVEFTAPFADCLAVLER
jgi:peptidoglycan/xylan/chitin deacetylase (PgdA/CDA1 family)